MRIMVVGPPIRTCRNDASSCGSVGCNSHAKCNASPIISSSIPIVMQETMLQ